MSNKLLKTSLQKQHHFSKLTAEKVRAEVKKHKKFGPYSNKLKLKIIYIMLQTISSGDGIGLRPYDFARSLGISYPTAKAYLKEITENHITLNDFNYIHSSMSGYFEKVMKDFYAHYKKTDNISEKMTLNREIINTFESYTKMLENFGIKEKIPDMLAYKDFTEKETTKEKDIIILAKEVDIEAFEREQRQELENVESE